MFADGTAPLVTDGTIDTTGGWFRPENCTTGGWLHQEQQTTGGYWFHVRRRQPLLVWMPDNGPTVFFHNPGSWAT